MCYMLTAHSTATNKNALVCGMSFHTMQVGGMQRHVIVWNDIPTLHSTDLHSTLHSTDSVECKVTCILSLKIQRFCTGDLVVC